MGLLEILYLVLAVGFLLMTCALVYTAYRLSKVLKALERLMEDIEDAVKDVRILKDAAKIGFSSLLQLILNKQAKKRSSR